MDDADRLTLGDLYYNANSVFEYGLGESTLIAAHTGVPRYAGIDSDAEWVAQARKNSKLDHFRFNFADIGAIQAWGNPIDESLINLLRLYWKTSHLMSILWMAGTESLALACHFCMP